MACNLNNLSGISIDCGSRGGLKNIWIAPVSEVTGITVSASTEGVEIISSISMSTTNLFNLFSFRKGNGSMTAEGNQNDKDGTFFVNQTVTCQFNAMNKFQRNELVKLSTTPCYVIAQDNNDQVWFIGYGSSAYGTATAQSGAERGDLNGYNLTITAECNDYPLPINKNLLASICDSGD